MIKHNNCVYLRVTTSPSTMCLLLYVDNMLIASCDWSQIINLNFQLSSKFEIKYLGCAKKIVGAKVIRNGEKASYFLPKRDIVHTNYNSKSITFDVVSLKLSLTKEDKKEMEMIPYENAMGNLIYLMICIRPNIHML